MAAVRKLAEKLAAEGGDDIETAWNESVKPIIELLRSRFERLKLKGQQVCKK